MYGDAVSGNDRGKYVITHVDPSLKSYNLYELCEQRGRVKRRWVRPPVDKISIVSRFPVGDTRLGYRV